MIERRLSWRDVHVEDSKLRVLEGDVMMRFLGHRNLRPDQNSHENGEEDSPTGCIHGSMIVDARAVVASD
jgi:hypothetical protein